MIHFKALKHSEVLGAEVCWMTDIASAETPSETDIKQVMDPNTPLALLL